jgi:hypothetical protein
VNLSTAGMLQSARQDVVARQLSTTASGGGATFDPTSKARISNHETDKQAEDNATWFFEYRALLNSKLTTLTTSLTSAYTTDMDASMGFQGYSWGTKNAMQGITGGKNGTTTYVDPGAARTAYAYFKTFGSPNVTDYITTWDGTTATPAVEGATVTVQFVSNSVTNSVTGTTTFLTGGTSTFILDQLFVDQTNTANNVFTHNKGNAISVAGITTGKKVGNQFELTLYKFFAKPENLDLLRLGLFQNVFVVGTSSLPTGSQVQGSVKLDYDQNTGRIVCTQERYAAFFHS